MANHPRAGRISLYVEGAAELLFCDNDTNTRRLFGIHYAEGYFKDAFHEYLIGGSDGRKSRAKGNEVRRAFGG